MPVSSVESSSEQSEPEQSSAPVSKPEPPVSSSEPESKPEPPVFKPQTIVYTHDEKNACTVTYNGDSITVKGVYGDLFDGVGSIYPSMNVKSSVDDGILTCVLTPKSTYYDRKFGSFIIYDKGDYTNTVFIDLSDGTLKCPDTSGLTANNDRALNAIVIVSQNKLAQYVTMDGKRDKVPQILDEVQKLSDEICKGIDSDYEKLRAISRWVSDNIYYDHPIYNQGAPQYCLSLEYTLTNRAGICGSYANLTAALCAAQGIRCLNITGMAVNNGKCYLQNTIGGYHEWNVAEIDGREIIVDSGWNSGLGINNDGSLKVKKPRYKYFDIGEEVFSFDHKAQSAEYRNFFSLIQ